MARDVMDSSFVLASMENRGKKKQVKKPNKKTTRKGLPRKEGFNFASMALDQFKAKGRKKK
jgi:hypothetical protein